MKYTIQQLKSVLEEPQTTVLWEFRDMAADYLDWKSKYHPQKFVNESPDNTILVSTIKPSFVWTVAWVEDSEDVYDHDFALVLLTGFHFEKEISDDFEAVGWFICQKPWNKYGEKELSLCLDCPTCARSGQVKNRDFEGNIWSDKCSDCDGSGTLESKILYEKIP